MGSTKPEHIQLKDSIAGTLGDQRAIQQTPGRTVDRDAAAEWLLENVVAEGDWPLSYNELAERSEWSAGHWRNTYERYFEPADNAPSGENADGDASAASAAAAAASGGSISTRGMSIDVPDTVSDMPSFIAGISVGYKLAQDEDQ